MEIPIGCRSEEALPQNDIANQQNVFTILFAFRHLLLAKTTGKSTLRAWAKLNRQKIGRNTVAQQIARVSGLVLSFVHKRQAKTVALYASFGDEFPTEQLALCLQSNGIATAYPRTIARNPMQFSICSHKQLVSSSKNYAHPSPALPKISLSNIPISIVPGLAFGLRSFSRLGWGGGHYDRSLSSAPNTLRLGLAFEYQLIRDIPVAAHDITMDAIVTPSGLRIRYPLASHDPTSPTPFPTYQRKNLFTEDRMTRLGVAPLKKTYAASIANHNGVSS